MSTKKRTITAEDLYRFRLVTDCDLSPDGKHIVSCIEQVDRGTQEKYSNLWVVPTDNAAAHQFTHGDHTDSKPTWSPDGTRLAFLSNRDNEDQPQIYVVAFTGGEARQLTNLKGEFDSFEWSPDGTQLVCQFRKKDREAIEREESEQTNELA
jgi:Tol biopolymer transport system component